MNYKKGILSVVLWFLYAMVVGTGMVGTAMTVILPSGAPGWIGLVIAGSWLAVTGLVVFLLHTFLVRRNTRRVDNRQQVRLIIESLIVVILLAVGIVLRTREVMLYEVTGESVNVWFEAAKVTESAHIPQVVHGAVYFYLQVLHGLLVFLGNKMTAALILQAVLQILSGIFLYFAVRKLSGTVAAVTAFGYWMLCPVISATVILGPEELYRLLWMIGLCIIAESIGHFRQMGGIPGIRSVIGFFFASVAVGVLGYLDVTGLLLLLVILSVNALETYDNVRMSRRIGTGALGLLGTATGFFVCIALDAVSSGKVMENVLLAWWKVCMPKGFTWPVAIINADGYGRYFHISAILVVTILGIGVFGFWCRKKSERQAVWLALMIGTTLLICYGMTSEEMPGLSLLYVLTAIVAGAGVQSVLPYGRQTELQPSVEVAESDAPENKSQKRRLKIQDLETEEVPEETEETEQETHNGVQWIENPLPVPKKHVSKVLDYKWNDVEADFDYPVAEDDDFDH